MRLTKQKKIKKVLQLIGHRLLVKFIKSALFCFRKMIVRKSKMAARSRSVSRLVDIS